MMVLEVVRFGSALFFKAFRVSIPAHINGGKREADRCLHSSWPPPQLTAALVGGILKQGNEVGY